MISTGPLSGPRLRAAAFAVRVRWVERVERERDEARARAAALEVEVEQLRRERGRDTLGGRIERAARDTALRRAERRAELADAARDSALDGLGRIAAAAGMPGAPQRYNVDELAERVRAAARSPKSTLSFGNELGDWTAPRAAYDVDGDVLPPPGRPAPDGVVDAEVQDAEMVWTYSRGWACGACGTSIIETPCPEHQPKAHARAGA